MASVLYQIVLLLLLALQIGISVSSSGTISSSSLYQSQKTKISSRKVLLENPMSFSSSKSVKKKPILESKEEKQISSSKITKKKLISDEISGSKVPRKKLSLVEKEDKQMSSSSKVPKKKLSLVDKTERASSNSKLAKKKLTLKEEVERLISGTDIVTKPLKKKPNSDTNPLKSKKPNSNSTTTSTISPKLKLPELNKTSNAKTKITNENPESNEQTDLDINPSLLYKTNDEDLISDLPDLIDRLSSTSRAYITAANSNIAAGVKPFLGSKYAPIVAPIASALFLVIPLFLLINLLKRLESCLSLVRNLLVFIQAYLAIYFATLAVTAVVTGLEPLRFFYATSASSYTWTQVAQSFGYVVYLVLQLVDLLAVFSSSASEGSRALALAQMLVGLAVGLHYYASVFHRAVMGEPPRANWRVHGVYSACFMLICICARAERRKKAYVSDEGTEEWKKS